MHFIWCRKSPPRYCMNRNVFPEEPPPIRPVRKVIRMRPPLFSCTSSSSSTGTSNNQNRRQLRRRPRTTSSSSSPIVVIHRRQMMMMGATVIPNSNARMSTLGGGSAPFASYTPVKAAIDTTFELGVTRTPSPSSTASSTCSSNEQHQQHHPQQQHQVHHHPHHQNPHQHSNGHQQHHHQQQHQGRINGDASAGGLLLLNGDSSGEPESIQYLKPASDEQTVNWSQGTRVTDLLF
nr:homeobox protein OTX1-like [Aedes albopictus]